MMTIFVSEEEELSGSRRICAVQGIHGGWNASGVMRRHGGCGPSRRRLVAGGGVEGAHPRRSTSGSIRQLQAENRSAFGGGNQSRPGLRSRHTEREASHRGLRVPVHTAGHQEMGVLSSSRGVGGECSAGFVERDGGTGGHVAADQSSSAAAVGTGTRGATRHNRDAEDVAAVQEFQQRGCIQQRQLQRVRLQYRPTGTTGTTRGLLCRAQAVYMGDEQGRTMH